MGYFKIEKPFASFSERKWEAGGNIALLTAFLLFCFGIEVVFKRADVKFSLWFTGALFSFFTFYFFRKAYNYLQKIEIEESLIRITYFQKNEELVLEDHIQNTKVKLVNTTTRNGFGCEVVLLVKEKKFVVDSRDDWSLVEIKNLFLLLVELKAIKLPYEDKANLAIIERNIKKKENI